MKKTQSIVWTQHVMRNTPTLAPETEYCLPGSRFARMMQLARMGASDRVFRRHIPGIDRLTIRALRRLAAQQRGEEMKEEHEEGQMAG